MTGNSQTTCSQATGESQPILVSICICTYKRPHLYKCMESIAGQTLTENISVRFIVVDNCPDNSAAPYVEQFKKSHNLVVDYFSCSVNNLSTVRNKAIETTSGQYVAMVDDDEVVSKLWLKSLIECSTKYNADVVIGPVKNQYSYRCPDWIKENDLMARISPKTGKRMQTGHSGNALVKTSTLSSYKITFAEKLGRSGGEDTDFFFRLHKAGAKIVGCREAIASEVIDPTRENMQYLIQENKRIGQAFCRVFWPSYSLSQKLRALIKILTKAICFGLGFLFTLPFGKSVSAFWRLRWICNIEKIRYLVFGNNTIFRYCV